MLSSACALTATLSPLSSEFDGESEKCVPDLDKDFQGKNRFVSNTLLFLRSSGYMNLVGESLVSWRLFCQVLPATEKSHGKKKGAPAPMTLRLLICSQQLKIRYSENQ